MVQGQSKNINDKPVASAALLIDGVTLTPLKKICDERGKILHMMRSDSPAFKSFGEIYFSVVYPGVVKGWHIHTKMTLNYAVPVGLIKLVLYDDRAESATKGKLMEIITGEDNYQLITIPPGIWNGFKGIGTAAAMVANCSSIPHDPTEIQRLDPFKNDIPYSWDLKHG